MINPRQLDRARAALRILRQLELEPFLWASIAALVHDVTLAVHARDESQLRKALADLERVGAERGDWRVFVHGQVRRGEDFESTDGAPPEVLSRLDELAAELTVAAAEIRRIPHIDIAEELPLRPGTRFTACVRLDTSPSRPGESAEAFILRNPPADLRELPLDVWLTTTAHFTIDGPATGTITVRPADPRSTEARFTVIVRDRFPVDAGRPALRATFDYKLRASGSVRREVPITLDDGTPLGPASPQAESGHVLVHGRAQAPDLEVVIKRDLGQAGRYSVLLRTGLLGGVTMEGSWMLPEGTEEFVKRIMSDFADANATATGRRRSLESAGIEFFDASPDCFQNLYWRMADAGTLPRNMFLISDERAIPWELMIPRRREPGQPWQTMPPLGAGCAIGRWHQAEHFSPGQRLPLSDSLVLAPDYPGRHKLPNSAGERDLVLIRFPGQDVPATFDELDAFYAANSASLLHFVCHGYDSTLQAILLLKRQTLSAQQTVTSGLGDACRKRHPLVFLNACEVGRPGLGIAKVGGFPAAFIACDAGAIIATLWSVDDAVAHEVAAEFYTTVGNDPARPFADVVRQLRARAYDEGGADSFAAYCFYGDPLAAMERP